MILHGNEPAELWGTFAVDDHLRRRPFAAELILFDRLVIPTPPDWSRDALASWPDRWQPQRLRELMDVLGDRAIAMPWDAARRERWEREFAQFKDRRAAARRAAAAATAADVRDIRRAPADTPAKFCTRRVIASIVEEADAALFNLVRTLPIPAGTAIDTAVAYGSYGDFHDALGQRDEAAPAAGQDALVFSWDFLVPDDGDLLDRELLAKINALNRNSEFVEHRRAFNALRRTLAAAGADPLAARTEVERRLASYQRIIGEVAAVSTARTALTYAAIAFPLADLIAPGLGTAGGVTLGLASHTWPRWAPDPQPDQDARSVAVVHDLREAFSRR